MYDDIYSKLSTYDKYGFGFICGGTSVRPDNIIQKVMTHVKPIESVEIGTYRGLSTVVIASMCSRVHTFDIKYWGPDVDFIWTLFGVNDKIVYTVVNDDFTKKNNLKDKDFDFAYIDGDHTIPRVEFDFDITKKCGHVLFDDADGIAQFLKTIDSINITKRFAYWSADGDYEFIKDIQKELTWKEIEINGRIDKMAWGKIIMQNEGIVLDK